MALEERNGNYYYYKKEREGGRVVSKYYGKGKTASLVARMDEIEREKKREEAEIQRKNRETQAKIDGELSLLESEVKKLTATALLDLGFHKTKSREWRIKSNGR